jgi:hypothetical protein
MNTFKMAVVVLVLALASPSLTQPARADVITDWNDKACAIVAKVGPGSTGHRMMAIIQAAVFEAVNSIDPRYTPYQQKILAPPGASIDAAVAAANRGTLLTLMPGEKASIDAVYQSALAVIVNNAGKADGLAVGEQAAGLILARAAKDGADAPETYHPYTTPGQYVPTIIPVFSTWVHRTPWIMEKPSQFRPGPPPPLSSDTWARDLEEVKSLGRKSSTARTAEQTAIARFWEETRPLIYHPIVRSVAVLPGRTVVQNARLFAAASMAVDDALIAVYDAKYTYNFWRPITAARNEHVAGTARVPAEPGWTPFIPTPMHPEYPCAHCISAGAIGAVLTAELGSGPVPALSSSSPTAEGAVREWKSIADFMEEVQMARIYDGVHYRNSTIVGNNMGVKIGGLVTQKFATPSPH